MIQAYFTVSSQRMRLPRKIGRGFFEDFPFPLGPLQLLTQPLVLLAQLLQRGVFVTRCRWRSELGMPVTQTLLADADRRCCRLEGVPHVGDQTDRRALNSSENRRAWDDGTDGSTTAGTDCLLMTNSFQGTVLASPPESVIAGPSQFPISGLKHHSTFGVFVCQSVRCW